LTETFVCADAHDADRLQKPHVDRVETTTHQESRNGYDIDHVVLHYTTSRNIEGTINWFQTAPVGQRTSAHYIIGRDGLLVQLVPDAFAAWHAGNRHMNLRSIGIEHVAAAGDEITQEQSETSLALVRWLCAAYDIPSHSVIPHVAVKPTSCCGDLFRAFGGRLGGSSEVQSAAIQRWLAT